MKAGALTALFFAICYTSASADTIYTNTSIGYSVYMPDHWVRKVVDSSTHRFYDSLAVYKSQLSIVRHGFSTTDYPKSTDWTRANFIAYKLCVQYSVDPFAAMRFYDTAQTVKQGTLWATESFSTFFSLDTTMGAWSEYVRFTASGTAGYELYALGDTADMRKNISTYAALLKMVKLPSETGTVVVMKHQSLRVSAIDKMLFQNTVVCDPLGRLRTNSRDAKALPAGMYVSLTAGKKAVCVR
ncbi:MAG: hypothetical protein MUF22_01685 [Chitinispirillaceae bacterium]|jgi:hypothetical protein|nr:hypothetical protein [Chitinispirillaceae bacterium]